MKIASGVEMLEISANIMGTPSIIYPTLIWDNDTVILVDAGYPGQLPKIREAMEKAGVSFVKLCKVIITHQDIDHIGSLPDILHESQHKVKVLAHEGEKPYIQGEKRILKITPEVMAHIDSWPEELRKKLKPVFENPPKANVDKTVDDGEELPYCGGITVIHTPGHTPGHICMYLKQSKILITGDALNVVDGQLLGPVPQYSHDIETATESLKKLAQYEIETVISYHGGIYKGNVNQRIAELANR